MKKLIKLWPLAISFLFVNITCFAQNNFFGSTVRIYAHTQNGKVKGGTGFAIRLNNRNYIATCYHVINQSEKIEIYSIALRQSYECHIVAYDDMKDIAVLDGSFTNSLTPLMMGNIPANLYNMNGVAIGNPDDNNEFILKMRFTTQNGVVPSTTLIDNQGQFIFKRISGTNFNVVPFDATIYGGMSGAPIIVNNQVIGLVSASINTGGSIGWGIPIGYISNLTIGSPLVNGLGLPDLKSLTTNNYNLTRSLVFDNDLKDDFEPLLDVSKNMADDFTKLSANLRQANTIIENFRRVRGQISNNMTQNEMNETAHTLKLSIDSILFYTGYASSATDGFNAAKNTFDQVFKSLKDNYDNDEKAQVDSILADKILTDIKSFNNREDIARIKYANKASEWISVNQSIPTSIFYTDQTVFAEVNQWLALFDVQQQYATAQIDYFNILNKEYLIFKSYTDLMYESMAYKKEN